MRGFSLALQLRVWPPTIAFQFDPNESEDGYAETHDTVGEVEDTDGLTMGYRRR